MTLASLNLKQEAQVFALEHNFQPAFLVEMAMQRGAELAVGVLAKDVHELTDDLERRHGAGGGGELSGTIPPLEKSEI